MTEDTINKADTKRITHCRLFLTFLKIGLFTFGGGYAMIPLIFKEVIENNQWIEEEEFSNLLALAQSSPGPVSVNSSVFVGYKLKGFLGAVTALLGTVLPSFVIILTLVVFFIQHREAEVIEKALRGMRPAVVALIAVPAYRLGKKLKPGFFTMLYIAVIVAMIAYYRFSPVLFVVLGVAIGTIYTLVWQDKSGKT